MSAERVIVDANIAFKALVSQRGDLRDRIDPSADLIFHAPAYLFVEIFKHKERLSRATGLSENELLEAIHVLVSRMEFVNESNISLTLWIEAFRLCKDVDEKDTPYVALALHLKGKLWTEDLELKAGLQARGFNDFYRP